MLRGVCGVNMGAVELLTDRRKYGGRRTSDRPVRFRTSSNFSPTGLQRCRSACWTGAMAGNHRSPCRRSGVRARALSQPATPHELHARSTLPWPRRRERPQKSVGGRSHLCHSSATAVRVQACGAVLRPSFFSCLLHFARCCCIAWSRAACSVHTAFQPHLCAGAARGSFFLCDRFLTLGRSSRVAGRLEPFWWRLSSGPAFARVWVKRVAAMAPAVVERLRGEAARV